MQDFEPIQGGELSIRYLVDGSSDGEPGLFELGVPPLRHDNNDEYIFVLAGC